MLAKMIAVGCVLVAAPFCIVQSAHSELLGENHEAAACASADLGSRVGRLQAALAAANRRAHREKERADKLQTQLAECMELVLQSSERSRPSCSTNRSLLTHYRWMRKNGFDEQAGRVLERIAKDCRNRASSLASLARGLMTQKRYAGQNDALALALIERAVARHGEPTARMLDTHALASFLNGRVDEAVALQERAIASGHDHDEYRRRLCTYRAAQRMVRDTRPACEVAVTATEETEDEN